MANRDYTSILDEIGTDIPFINKLPHLRSKVIPFVSLTAIFSVNFLVFLATT